MRRHDNILFITTQQSWLSKDGTNVVVRVDKQERFRAPLHTLGQIVCFGNVTCSPFLMGFCTEEGVGLSFHTEHGRFLCRAVGRSSGSVLLRRSQHHLSSAEATAATAARIFVAAKLANSRRNLQRVLRDYPDTVDVPALTRVVRVLAGLCKEVAELTSLQRIRGVEGEGGQLYFSVFNELLRCHQAEFAFVRRTRRPPRDRINALLSFIYTLLANDVASACESVGLDPQLGFLHADRPGRSSLALDLMEEFRPFLADRLALTLINRQQLSPRDFNEQESGGVLLAESARRSVIQAYQKRKEEELQHPFLGEKITIGLLPFIQARLFSRWLRGELDAYPAYFVK